MTPDDTRDDERRERDRSGFEGAFRLGVGAGIRAVRDLLDASNARNGGRSARDDRRTRRKRFAPGRSRNEERSGRTRTKRIRVSGPDCLTDTRREDGTFVVTADVVGTDPADLSVCIDHGANDLLIREDGRILERVALPWRSVAAREGSLNNGVLEVRLHPGEDGRA